MNRKLILTLVILCALLSMCVQTPKMPKNKTKPILNLNTLKVFTTVLEKENKWCAVVTITLPTPCYKISYTGMNKTNENITLNFACEKTSGVCTQVITKYNKTVCFGELPKGNYTVYIKINGEVKNKVKFKV